MHLLIATGLYPPEIGGPATYTKLLEERLPAQGIEVVVLPFRTVRIFLPGIRHAVYFLLVIWKSLRADMVLVQDTVSTGFPVALASIITRKPYIVRVPGDYAWEQGVQRFGVTDSIEEFQKKRYGVRVRLLQRIQRFVVRRARRVIAPSEYLARIIAAWLPEPRHIDAIYNGIQIPETSAKRDTNLIVTSGRLVPWKGFADLIDIVARHADWTLVILGDGPEKEKLTEQARSLNAQYRVILPGQVANADARAWFDRASVFVLNSTYEGLSHTLIEAMAGGAPTIATNVGGNPEVIRAGDGVLVAPRDPETLEKELTRLLSDTELRTRLGDAAALRARAFSIDTTVAKTAELLHANT